jgi:hypothetical protein
MAKGSRSGRRGYKPRDYGTAKDTATALIRAAGGVDNAADRVRVGKSQLQRYMDPDESSAHMPLDVAESLTRTTGSPVLAEFFAHLVGGVLLPNVQLKESGSPRDWQRDGARIGRETSSYFTELAEALKDGQLTERELRRLLQATDGVIRAAAEARTRLDALLERADAATPPPG